MMFYECVSGGKAQPDINAIYFLSNPFNIIWHIIIKW